MAGIEWRARARVEFWLARSDRTDNRQVITVEYRTADDRLVTAATG